MAERNRRIAVVPHCLLNQNSVLTGWERSEGPFAGWAVPLMETGWSLYQLPCPELLYGGVKREPQDYGAYDTADYRQHCRRLLAPSVEGLLKLKADGCLFRLIGIEESPSCDLRHGKGVLMEELAALLPANFFSSYDQVPEKYCE